MLSNSNSIPPELQSKELERALFQGAKSGDYAIMVTDHSKPGEPIAYVNSAFEDLTGYKLAEVIGFGFLHEKDREQLGIKELDLAIKNGVACSTLVSDQKEEHDLVWYQVSITPVFAEDGQLTHFFGYLRDVTALVATQQIEESRETFIAKLAHDLMSPLLGAEKLFALIIGGVYGQLVPELQKTLVLLSRSNQKALDLVMNLLESYRLRNGADLMHFEKVDLPSLIEHSVDEVRASISEKQNLDIEVSVSQNFPECCVDRLAISRLLANLLGNSVKFTPSGGLIQISANSANGEIVLQVRDNGIGIRAEDRDSIFQKCKRNIKQNRYVPGCGLGLFICSEIVKAHQGTITYESVVNVGTTFTVILPLAPAKSFAEPTTH